MKFTCRDGGIGRRPGLKILCQAIDVPVRFWFPAMASLSKGAFFLHLNKIFLFKRGKDCKGWRSQFRSVAKE